MWVEFFMTHMTTWTTHILNFANSEKAMHKNFGELIRNYLYMFV